MARRSPVAPISRLSRRLLFAVGAGFLAILLTLAIVGLALHQRQRAIQHDLELIADMEEPESAAAYEMEINILGAGLAVKKYLFGGDAAQHDRLAKDEADFDRFHAEYVRLADGEVEQELAREIAILNRRYREFGRELMRLRDRRDTLHAELAADVEEVDRLFAGVEFAEPALEAKYRESLSLVADVGELAAWQGSYVAGAHEPHRQRVTEDLANVRDHVASFQALPLNPAEREMGVRVMRLVERLADGVQGIVEVGNALSEQSAEFSRVRDEIDELVDERIQARTRAELKAAHDNVRANLRRLLQISLLLIGIAASVSLGAAIVIGRQSLQFRDASVDELRASLSRLSASEQRRGALLRRLVAAQEEERARIARELHDQLSQDLSALSLGLASVARAAEASDSGAVRQREVRALQELASHLADEVRFVAWKLRPAILDDLGLHGALSNLAETWTRHSGVPIDLYSDLAGRRLPRERETTLYRVAQEALTNVAKHARAKSVSVVLQSEGDELRLVVEDDGCGFDPATASGDGSVPLRLGLLGMKERLGQFGGSLEIDSAPGKGTTVVARIPAGAAEEDAAG